LLDYDCQLNYACWNFEAGINRDNTYLFNVLQLSKQYDPEGHYIKKWCPELKEIPDKYIHNPWSLPDAISK
jgi:deoxyribodipyrimidine photo-lyase